MLRELIRREGIDQVLLALADAIQSMPPDQLPGEAIAAEQRQTDTITNVRTGQSFPVTVHGPRIVSAEPPKRKVIVGRPEPGPTRIVSAKPPPRAPRRK